MTHDKTRLILLLRHGRTPGNLAKRYVGARTDESLAPEGVLELKRLSETLRGVVEEPRVVVSPMRRCVESAAILFPGTAPRVSPGLREIDFGEFEGHTAEELSGNAKYQAWIDSGGTAPFPGGETRDAFIRRTCDAFRRDVFETDAVVMAFVCHGGSIMAMMSALFGGDYFDYQVGPAEGFRTTVKTNGDEIHPLSYARIDARLRP